MKDEVLQEMIPQLLKFFHMKTYEEFQEEFFENGLQCGDFQISEEEWNHILETEPTELSEFDIGDGLVLVPYLCTGRSEDSCPLAVYNLKQIGNVSRVLECATLYKKVDDEKSAYLLYIEGEGGLSLHKF